MEEVGESRKCRPLSHVSDTTTIKTTERLTTNQEVAGSSPARIDIFFVLLGGVPGKRWPRVRGGRVRGQGGGSRRRGLLGKGTQYCLLLLMDRSQASGQEFGHYEKGKEGDGGGKKQRQRRRERRRKIEGGGGGEEGEVSRCH